MFCPQCGAALPQEARFCMRCGKPVPQLAAATPAGAVPAAAPASASSPAAKPPASPPAYAPAQPVAPLAPVTPLAPVAPPAAPSAAPPVAAGDYSSPPTRWPFFVALVAAVLGSLAAQELGQVACVMAARAAGYTEPGATPHVAALAKALEATRPAGIAGGIVAFFLAVLALDRGFRWLSLVAGVLAGAAAGAVTGYAIGS